MSIAQQLNDASVEAYKIHSIASLGATAAFSEDAEISGVGFLLQVIAQHLEDLHDKLHALRYSDIVKHADELSKAGAE